MVSQMCFRTCFEINNNGQWTGKIENGDYSKSLANSKWVIQK
jgi:hypothetical protein